MRVVAHCWHLLLAWEVKEERSYVLDDGTLLARQPDDQPHRGGACRRGEPRTASWASIYTLVKVIRRFLAAWAGGRAVPRVVREGCHHGELDGRGKRAELA